MGNCCQERKKVIVQEEVKKEDWDEPLTFTNKSLTVKNPKNIHEVYDLKLLTQIQQFKNLVYDAVHQKSRTKFIAKQIKKEDNLKKILGTIDILSLCDHQNIAKTIEYFENEDEIWLILEYYQGGTLHEEINRRIQGKQKFVIEEIRIVAQQLLSAIRYIHKLQVIHKYIMSEHICLVKHQNVENIKITHFEQASIKKIHLIDLDDSKQQKTLHGQIPPEILLDKEKPSKAYDLWSIGVILFTMTFQQHPLQKIKDLNDLSLWYEQKRNPVNDISGQQKFKEIPQTLQELLSGLLAAEPKKRLSASRALKNQFLKVKVTSQSQLKQMKDNFVQYGQFNVFQKLSFAYLTRYIKYDEKKRNMEILFRQIDANQDGYLSRKELEAMFQKADKESSPEEISEFVGILIDSLDTDKDGKISFSVGINYTKIDLDQNIQEAFSFFDSDNSGSITTPELLSKLDVKRNSVQKVEELKKNATITNEGNLNYEDFANLIKSNLECFEKDYQDKAMNLSQTHNQISFLHITQNEQALINKINSSFHIFNLILLNYPQVRLQEVDSCFKYRRAMLSLMFIFSPENQSELSENALNLNCVRF